MRENLPPVPPRPFETIGRVLDLLLGHTAAARTTSVSGLHTWQRRGGGCVVEWTGGPHAREVVEEMQMLADDDEVTTTLCPGDITDVTEYRSGDVRFRARGVLFELRGIDTIGIEAEHEKLLEEVRSAV